MSTSRTALAVVGVVVAGYGGWLLVTRQDTAQLWGAVRWLVVGVVLHDLVLTAAVLLLGLVVTRLVPAAARGPVAVGGIVLGSVTLLAIPVLLSYGAKADNPTLLDRNYPLGWTVLAAVVALAVAVAVVVRVRTRKVDA